MRSGLLLSGLRQSDQRTGNNGRHGRVKHQHTCVRQKICVRVARRVYIYISLICFFHSDSNNPSAHEKMAHSTTIQRYRRQSQDEGAFSESPSGSEWNESHLRWLGIDLETGCAISDIVKPEYPLPPSGIVSQYLQSNLGKRWEEIVAPVPTFKQTSIYARFKVLAEPRVEKREYMESSPPLGQDAEELEAQPPSSSPSSSHFSNSTVHPGSLPPVPHVGFQSGILPRLPDRRISIIRAVQDEEELEPRLPSSSQTSDSTFQPGPSSLLPRKDDDENDEVDDDDDKSEKEVKTAARGFMNEIEDAVREAVRTINTSTV